MSQFAFLKLKSKMVKFFPDFRASLQGPREELQPDEAEDVHVLQVPAGRSQRIGPIAAVGSSHLCDAGTGSEPCWSQKL